jgi:hypothetical protein
MSIEEQLNALLPLTDNEQELLALITEWSEVLFGLEQNLLEIRCIMSPTLADTRNQIEIQKNIERVRNFRKNVSQKAHEIKTAQQISSLQVDCCEDAVCVVEKLTDAEWAAMSVADKQKILSALKK